MAMLDPRFVKRSSAVASGTTGSGKTEHIFSQCAPLMTHPNGPALIVCDPHGGLARKLAICALAHGMFKNGKVIYDPVAATSRVPGYDFLVPSNNPDPLQRAAEHRERIEETIGVLLRSSGKMDASRNPIIYESLNNALLLYLNQRTPVPFTWLPDCFSRDADAHHYMLANCTDSEVHRRFAWYQSLPLREWDFQCSAAIRLLRKVTDSPQFCARLHPTFDLAAHLNRGGILLLDGSSRGNLSRADMSVIMSQPMLRTIQLGRSGGLYRLVIIVIDEAANAGLIDGNVARALAESRKWNVVFILIVQNPLNFAEPWIVESVYQNCPDQFWFLQVNSDAIRKAAEFCAMANYDPYLVHHTERRTRLENAGFDEFTVDNSSRWESGGREGTSTNTQHVSRPRYRERDEEITRYYSASEQQRLFEKKFQSLRPGEHFYRSGNRVSPEPIRLPLTRTLWDGLMFSSNPPLTLADKKLNDALEILRNRPEYQTRPIPSPPPPAIPQGRGHSRLGRQSKRES